MMSTEYEYESWNLRKETSYVLNCDSESEGMMSAVESAKIDPRFHAIHLRWNKE